MLSRPGSIPSDTGFFVTPEVFGDGPELYAAVCEHGLEGIVAKRLASTYRQGQSGWVKVKNPAYWRHDQEIESLRRSLERRVAA